MDSIHKIYVVSYFGHETYVPFHVIGPLTDDFKGLCDRVINQAAERLVERYGDSGREWNTIGSDELLREMIPMLAEEGYVLIRIDEVCYPERIRDSEEDRFLTEENERKVLEVNTKNSKFQRERIRSDGSEKEEEEEDGEHCRSCGKEVAGETKCELCEKRPPLITGWKTYVCLCNECAYDLDGKTLCLFCFNSVLGKKSAKEYYR